MLGWLLKEDQITAGHLFPLWSLCILCEGSECQAWEKAWLQGFLMCPGLAVAVAAFQFFLCPHFCGLEADFGSKIGDQGFRYQAVQHPCGTRAYL